MVCIHGTLLDLLFSHNEVITSTWWHHSCISNHCV